MPLLKKRNCNLASTALDAFWANCHSYRGASLFGLSLYTTEYEQAREINFPVKAKMQSTIRAAKLGKYFYAGDDSDTLETLNPELLHPWATTFEDYGLHNLVALNAFVGKTLTRDDYRVTQETVYQALSAIFLLSALTFVSLNLPLPVSLAGVLALWVSIRGPVECDPPACRASKNK